MKKLYIIRNYPIWDTEFEYRFFISYYFYYLCYNKFLTVMLEMK